MFVLSGRNWKRHRGTGDFVMSWWVSIFGLDLRAMALARMAAGLVLVVDLTLRCRTASVFLCDQGVAPRQIFLDNYASLAIPSIHLANDTLVFEILLLLVQIAVGICLAVGLHTRLASVISWFLLLSLQQRNPMVLNSGDSLLLMLLFWGMFMPWGRYWSLDARRGQADAEDEPSVVCTGGTVGWALQMVCLYLFAALHKLNPYWWGQDSAVFYALHLSHHATGAAELLTPYPGLLRALAPVVLCFELFLASTLLVPWARFRAIVLAAAAIMHLVFGAFLAIGIFRYSPLIGLIGLVPLGRLCHRDARARVELGSLSSMALLSIGLLVWAFNLESLGKGKSLFLPAAVTRLAPIVIGPQSWGVFAGPGLEQGGWFSVEVATAGGTNFDAWLGDRPFDRSRPALVSATYPDDRFRKYMLNLASMPAGSPYPQRFALWSRQQWDARHPGQPARAVKVWWVKERTLLSGQREMPSWTLLAEVGP